MNFFISDHHFNNFPINLHADRPFLHHIKNNKIIYQGKLVKEISAVNKRIDTNKLSNDEWLNIIRDIHKKKSKKIDLTPENQIFLEAKYLTIQTMNKEMIKRWNSKVAEEDTVYYLGDLAFPQWPLIPKNIIKQLNGKIIFIVGNHDGGIRNKLKDTKVIEFHNETNIKIKDTEVLLSHYPYLNPIYNKIAEKRPNIIKKYKKSLPSKYNILQKKYQKIKKTQTPKENLDFIRLASSLNLHIENEDEKKLYKKIKSLISKKIGTRPINNGKILIHGHTHNKEKRIKNMINVSVEAWNYYPASEEEILKLIQEYYDEINFLKNSDLNVIRENLNLYKSYASEPHNHPDKDILIIKSIYEAFSLESLKYSYPDLNKYSLEVIYQKKLLMRYSELKDKTFYHGSCRNACLAMWDAKSNKFYYERTKFGSKFIESINHPEQDNGFDLFIAKKEAPFNPNLYNKIQTYINH